MKKILWICILASFALFACEGKKPGTPEKPAGKTNAGDYLAKISDTAITEADLNKELQSLPPSIQQDLKSEGGMKRLLDEMIKKELLYLEAKRKGVDNNESFRERVEEFKKLSMVRLLLEAEIEKKATVSDKEIKDYYNKNKSEFVLKSPDGKTGIPVEFEKAKDFIKQRISMEKQQETFDSYLEILKKTYTVKLNTEAIGKLDKKAEKPKGESSKNIPPSGKAEKPQAKP